MGYALAGHPATDPATEPAARFRRVERSIVVVEDRAHWHEGHFPVAAAEMAKGFAAEGCTVELLTSVGWRDAATAPEVPFRVTTASRPVQIALGWANRRLMGSRRRDGRGGGVVGQVAAMARVVALAATVRRTIRRGGPRTEVVMFAYGIRPDVAAALYGRGRIIHHAVFLATGAAPSSVPGRLLQWRARRAEADRRRHGGGMCVACGNEALFESWRRRAPYLETTRIRHAVMHVRARVPDARDRLGIPPSVPVALVFGTWHGFKDLDTVWRAFAELPEWTLLVVGKVAASYEEWRRDHAAPAAVVVPGFVEAETVEVAYSAADVVVLSFVAGHQGDSGVLLEALQFGVPIVCTEGTRPGVDVEQLHLGAGFAAGDPHALAEAVTTVPRRLDPAVVAAATELGSAAAVARVHLDVFDGLGRNPAA